jgi:Chaperone of endosialidase
MKTAKNWLVGLVLALVGSTGWGQTPVFTKYGPVAGIQKNDGTTFQDTAAAAADVVSLWSGTCTVGNFLQGNGVCAVPAGVAPTGAANLVYATPNGSTGSASLRALVGADVAPINLGSTANGGVLSTSILLGTNGGTSNGFFSVSGPTVSLKTFTFPNASANVLTDNALVTVPQGGTGANTLTGLLAGNGTSAIGAATSANVISKWTGTCSSTTFLRGDGQCITPTGTGGTPGGANTNIQFNNAGAFGGDSGLTYAGSGGSITHSATSNAAVAITQTNSSNGTAATSQIQLLNDTPSSAYFGIAGSGNTQVQFLNGPTGAQAYYGTSNNIPVVFGQNNQYRFGLTSTVTGETARIIQNGTGNTSQAYWAFYDQSGTRYGYFGKAGTSDATITYDSDGPLKMTGNNGLDTLNIDASHNFLLSMSGSGTATTNPTWNMNNGFIATGNRPTLNSSVSGFYGGATTGGIAQFAMVDSAGGTNQKMFDVFVDTNSMNFRLDNDANTAATTWLQVVRSGTSVTNMTLGSPSVLINNTSGGGSGATLAIGGGSAFVDVINSGAGSGQYASLIASTSSGGAGSTAIQFDQTGGVGMPNLASGTGPGSYVCWVGGQVQRVTATCSTSSIRFKDAVADLDGGLDTVMKLRPVSFQYNAQAVKDGAATGRQVGFIAEEVQKVEPRLVGLDKEGKPVNVNYANATAVLALAIQQQQREIIQQRFVLFGMAFWLSCLTFRRRKHGH